MTHKWSLHCGTGNSQRAWPMSKYSPTAAELLKELWGWLDNEFLWSRDGNPVRFLSPYPIPKDTCWARNVDQVIILLETTYTSQPWPLLSGWRYKSWKTSPSCRNIERGILFKDHNPIHWASPVPTGDFKVGFQRKKRSRVKTHSNVWSWHWQIFLSQNS